MSSSKVSPTPSTPPAERDLGINADPLGVGAGVAAAAQPQPVTGSGAAADTTPGVSSAADRATARGKVGDGDLTAAMNPTQGGFSVSWSDFSTGFSNVSAEETEKTSLGRDGDDVVAQNSSAAGQMTSQTTLDALQKEHSSMTFDGLPYGDSKTT